MRWSLSAQFAQDLPSGAGFDTIMDLDGVAYRDLNNRRTFEFYLGSGHYFAKCHYGAGWYEILKNLCKLRKPLVDATYEWQAIHWLVQHDVPTLASVGYGVRGFCAANRQSFLITKAIENARSLEEYCLSWRQQPPTIAHKRSIILRLAQMVGKMHRSGMVHRDCYLCHFMYQEAGELNFTLKLIDLHRATVYRDIPRKLLVKDLAALAFSAQDMGFTYRDYWRFVKWYWQLASLRELTRVQHDLLQKIIAKCNWLYLKFHQKYTKQALLQTGMPLLDSRDLQRSQVREQLPRALLLQGFLDSIQLQQVLRFAKGKRLVAKGVWRNRDVVVKIFFHPLKSCWHARKELQGVKLLQQHLPTPRLLAVTKAVNLSATILVFEYIAAAENIEVQSGPDTVSKFLEQAIPLLATMHHNGLLQHDLHPNNMLLAKGQLWCIDGSDVQQFTGLSVPQAMENLALLLAQFSLPQLPEPAAWFAAYWQQRQELNINMIAPPLTFGKFAAILWQVRANRAAMLWEKAKRRSTATQIESNCFWRKIYASENHAMLAQIDALEIPSWFTSPQHQMLKAGNSATVIAYPHQVGKLVIKRYNIKNFWHGLLRLFKSTRAINSWCSASLLEFLAIPTAKPIMVLEHRFGFIKRESYLVMQQIDGETLENMEMGNNLPDGVGLVYMGNSSPLPAGEGLGERGNNAVNLQLNHIIATLASCGVVHGDFKATNWIFDKQTQKLQLIDLDALRVVTDRKIFSKLFAKDLQRLEQNFAKNTLPPQ